MYLNHLQPAADCVGLYFQPLYGLLQAKLQLITHAYFEEKDFSQISILKVNKNKAIRPYLGFASFFPVLTGCRSLYRSCTNT